jgi:hypothetical protein
LRKLLLGSKAAAMWFGIRHAKKTSINQWSPQPSVIQHTTATLRHSLLNNNKFKHKYYIITGIHKEKSRIDTSLNVKKQNIYPWMRTSNTVKKADGDR